MKLTVEQIVNSKDILSILGTQKMSAVIAYKLQRNIRKLNVELEGFQNAMKVMLEKYAENKDNGYQVREEEKEEYLGELNALLKEEVEVEISKIKIDDIRYEFTPFELMLIEWMFE